MRVMIIKLNSTSFVLGNYNNFIRKNYGTENEIRKVAELSHIHELIANGDPGDLDYVIDYFRKDPNRNLFYDKDKYEINKQGPDGFTALYVACMNGHLPYVKALLDNDASLLVKVKEESILDISIRWNQISVFKYLLSSFDWPYDYLKNCKRAAEKFATNRGVLSMIEHKLKSVRRTSKRYLCCSS